MLASQNKIQSHKAHIEKRISELQNRLRQPIRENTLSNSKPEMEEDLPYRRILVQKQNYIEPKEVTAIRQRESKIRDSRRRGANVPQPASNPDYDIKKRSIVYTDHVNNSRESQNMGSGQLPDDGLVFNPRRQGQGTVGHRKIEGEGHGNGQGQGRDQLYSIMAQILNNQKNLEKEIVFLRAEWSKQHAKNQNKPDEKTACNKNIRNEPKIEQIVSFQQAQSQPVQTPVEVVQIINKNTKRAPSHQMRGASARKREKSRKGQQQYEQETFAINQNCQQTLKQDNTTPHPVNKDKPSTKPNPKPKKPIHVQQEAHQKLHQLVLSQKSRKDRLIVSQDSKHLFWQQVQQKIQNSALEYRQALHRNNRHEHEHLVNTSELQRKLREDVISRVYLQCNGCLYK